MGNISLATGGGGDHGGHFEDEEETMHGGAFP